MESQYIHKSEKIYPKLWSNTH